MSQLRFRRALALLERWRHVATVRCELVVRWLAHSGSEAYAREHGRDCEQDVRWAWRALRNVDRALAQLERERDRVSETDQGGEA